VVLVSSGVIHPNVKLVAVGCLTGRVSTIKQIDQPQGDQNSVTNSHYRVGKALEMNAPETYENYSHDTPLSHAQSNALVNQCKVYLEFF
jgi:hypothetical protein